MSISKLLTALLSVWIVCFGAGCPQTQDPQTYVLDHADDTGNLVGERVELVGLLWVPESEEPVRPRVIIHAGGVVTILDTSWDEKLDELNDQRVVVTGTLRDESFSDPISKQAEAFRSLVGSGSGSNDPQIDKVEDVRALGGETLSSIDLDFVESQVGFTPWIPSYLPEGLSLVRAGAMRGESLSAVFGYDRIPGSMSEYGEMAGEPLGLSITERSGIYRRGSSPDSRWDASPVDKGESSIRIYTHADLPWIRAIIDKDNVEIEILGFMNVGDDLAPLKEELIQVAESLARVSSEHVESR